MEIIMPDAVDHCEETMDSNREFEKQDKLAEAQLLKLVLK
ncbi:hypothetical protein AAKU61_000634 [Undibacterium sp. GrIS 1.2]